MPKKKKFILIVTGKTERQLIDEMRVLELSVEQGIKAPKIRTCYLCKREEGENSLCFFADGSDKISLEPIKLTTYEVQMEEDISLHYLLCSECALLLEAMGGTEPEAQE